MAMSTERQMFDAEVERFRAWADNSPVPPTARNGEWACGYEGWARLYTAFDAFISEVPCREWSDATTQTVLYAIARDSDNCHLARSVATRSDDVLCLAERAITSPEWDAKWQIAAKLGRLSSTSPQAEKLLLRFAEDDDEYVRRCALLALADIGSLHVTDLVEAAWNTRVEWDEYPRMAVLYALWKINAPQLNHYLTLAEADGRPSLIEYAARIRSGNP